MSLGAFQLNGKNARVTGSNKGFGASIAVALAEAGQRRLSRSECEIDTCLRRNL
jgi:NAD(P)-dependent dehydrogenase (short-subunit alcohol dehydrogenase family)